MALIIIQNYFFDKSFLIFLAIIKMLVKILKAENKRIRVESEVFFICKM